MDEEAEAQGSQETCSKPQSSEWLIQCRRPTLRPSRAELSCRNSEQTASGTASDRTLRVPCILVQVLPKPNSPGSRYLLEPFSLFDFPAHGLVPDYNSHAMLPAPRGCLCARGLGPWEAESERLLVPVTDTLQLLLYQRPFSGGQARNPEAVPYLTRSVHTDCPAIRHGGRTMGALWERRSGLDYLTREW